MLAKIVDNFPKRLNKCVDANGGWVTPDVAIPTIQRLREFNIYFAEQPVNEGDIEGMAEVLLVPVAISAWSDRSWDRCQEVSEGSSHRGEPS